jgi:hypothetical protein
MRTFPGLLVDWPAPPDDDALGRAIAAIDDARPTAIDDREAGLRAFFANASDRDTAAALLREHDPSLTITVVDVPDEAWAERSQASIGAVRIGRIVVAPPWIARPHDDIEAIWIPSSHRWASAPVTTRQPGCAWRCCRSSTSAAKACSTSAPARASSRSRPGAWDRRVSSPSTTTTTP